MQESQKDSNPGPSFYQLELCSHSCWLRLDGAVVILKAWRYLQSSGIKLQHPTRGSYSTLMIAKSNWKVPLPLGEHTCRYCVFLMRHVEARNAYLVSTKAVISLWAYGESKKEKTYPWLLDFHRWYTPYHSIHFHYSAFVIWQRLLMSSLSCVLPLTISALLNG